MRYRYENSRYSIFCLAASNVTKGPFSSTASEPVMIGRGGHFLSLISFFCTRVQNQTDSD